MGTICEAKSLREKSALLQIPKESPGFYKWWSDKDTLIQVLQRIELSYETVSEYLETTEINGTTHYCIYVGVAIKESVRSRLDWHINQVNNPLNVRSGTLSTLRQTIASLVGVDMMDNQATNNFFDRLKVEYFLSDKPIKSDAAKNEIHDLELSYLHSNKLYILNIQDNKHPLAPTKKLREIRKEARQKALNK